MRHLFLNRELSQLAKEKGFDESCFAAYPEDIEELKLIAEEFAVQFTSDLTSEDFIIPAPLYQQIIDWFEDKYDIQVGVIKGHESGTTIREYFPALDVHTSLLYDTSPAYSTKKEALDKAIEEAFKLI